MMANKHEASPARRGNEKRTFFGQQENSITNTPSHASMNDSVSQAVPLETAKRILNGTLSTIVPEVVQLETEAGAGLSTLSRLSTILGSKLKTKGRDLPRLSSKYLPSWLGRYASEVAIATQTDEGMAVMLALSLVALCVQQKVKVCRRDSEHEEELPLWTISVLPPGNLKSAVFEKFTSVLNVWEKEQKEELAPKLLALEARKELAQKKLGTLSSVDAMVEQKRILAETLTFPRLWLKDVTPATAEEHLSEQCGRLGILSDEGGIFQIMAGLYAKGDEKLDVFLNGWTGAPTKTRRSKRDNDFDRTCISMGLTVQPEVVLSLHKSKEQFRGKGLLGRFLYLVPLSKVGQRDMSFKYKIANEIKESYKEKIFDLLRISSKETPYKIYLSDAADELFGKFAQSIEDKQGEEGEYEDIQDWTSKLHGQLMRIAAVLHMAKHGIDGCLLEVDVESMQSAIEICRVLIPHAEYVFAIIESGTMDNTKPNKDAEYALEWILQSQKTEFLQRDLQNTNHFKNREPAKRVRAALAPWVHHGILSEGIQSPTNKRSIKHIVTRDFLLIDGQCGQPGQSLQAQCFGAGQ